MGTNILKIKLESRSKKALTNIISIFALKAINMLIGFIIVPLTLNFLDPARYGIWITLSGIFNWFSLFDIGLGNGLRNKLTQAIAEKKIDRARIFISTTYASLLIIFILVYIIFIICNQYINWSSVLNVSASMKDELKMITAIIFLFFCLRFVTQLISTIALAKQDPALSQLLEVSGRVLSLICIYLITFSKTGNLLTISVIFTAIPVFTTLLISIYLFNTRYKELRPSLKLVQFKELKNILNLGIKFFIIQISFIVFYQTNNLIITNVFGPKEVTNYTILFQYFSIATFIFATLLTPYWSAFTDAYAKNDIKWIKKTLFNLKLFWLGLISVVFLLLFFSKYIINFWIGNSVTIDFYLCVTLCVYILINSLNGIYSHFLNGIGKVDLQLYLGVLFSIIYIPLGFYFAKHLGILGVLVPTIIYGLITVIIFEIQSRKILKNSANGIWNK